MKDFSFGERRMVWKLSDLPAILSGQGRKVTLPEEGEKEQPKLDMNRREVISAIGAIAAFLVTPSPVIAETSEDENIESPENGLDAIDLGTALAVVVSFARHVLYKGAVREIPLGPKSATEVGAMALARLTALKLKGGELGELANREIGEIIHGLIPLPLLVGLSDFTTTALRVDVEAIFKETVEKENLNNTAEETPRPEISKEKNEWQEYLDQLNQDIVGLAGEIAAVTSVIAPIGTTYSSSSLANDMKEKMLRKLYEQSYAKIIIELKEGDSEIDEGEVRQKAIERADSLFNGKLGFSHLQTTLAANTQGTWGIGDPPEIYFAMNHALNNPAWFGVSHLIGAGVSEAYTSGLNMLWLKIAEVPTEGFLSKLFESQHKTIKALLKTVKDREMRDVSFSKGRSFGEDFMASLNDSNDPEGKLRTLISRIPKARFQFSFGDYLKGKLDGLKGDKNSGKVDDSEGYGRIKGILEAFETTNSTNEDPDTQQNLLRAFLTGANSKDLLPPLDPTESAKAGQELAKLIKDIIANGQTEEANGYNEDVNNTASTWEANLDILRNSIIPAGSGEARLDHAISNIKEGGFDTDRFMELLKQPQTTPANVLAALTELRDDEDVVPGLEDDAVIGEAVAEVHAPTDHVQKHFLSHSANEVLWALLTQIPSVPAICRLAQISIPKAAGVEVGKKPSTAQLKKIIAILVPLTTAMSAVADNVAAYMFAETVLIDFFKEVFGEEAFLADPALKVKIGLIAKLDSEQAGSGTGVGNGANFSQEKCILLTKDDDPQGVAIDRIGFKMPETLPTKNLFTVIANATMVGGSIYYLWDLVDETEIKVKGLAQAA
ncbi:hypothetical protein KA119_00610 [Candidatus Gracilibacteria bacterium]|nr:hypothetical protein [Candidatus Gracilibacteria bacterium]